MRRNLSGRVQVIDTSDMARQHRETFYGKKVKHYENLPFSWPHFVKYLGKTQSEIYHSDKMLNGGHWELYKHIAEGDQYLFINDAITVLLNDAGEPIELRESGNKLRVEQNNGSKLIRRIFTQSYSVTGNMPKHVAVLADCKGVQWVSPQGKYYEARIPNTTIASARHPDTQETFLLVYSDEGVHFMITGPKLDITKDGIVG